MIKAIDTEILKAQAFDKIYEIAKNDPKGYISFDSGDAISKVISKTMEVVNFVENYEGGEV